MKTELLHSK